MSVLQRKELEDSPLADVHAIASELGIEGYRGMRREDLISAILDSQGGDGGDSAEPEAAERRDDEVDDQPKRPRRSRRGRRGRRDEAQADEPAEVAADETPEDAPDEPEGAEDDGDQEREVVTGVLDVQSNGSGFLRPEQGSDVYVSPAQIRRCELRAGDDVTGPVRPPRRNERHPSLIRVDQINGHDADSPEQRPNFDELTAVHASERLPAPTVLAGVPFGKGSRVAVAGPGGAGATRLLREIAATLTSQAGDVSIAVVLAGVRPEEVTDWRRDAAFPVIGGSFDLDTERQARVAVLAVERGKRIAERGGDAVVVIDSLAALDPRTARRVFGAARKLEEAGSLTVIAAVGEDSDHLHRASTRIVLAAGAADPTAVAELSGAQRADLLG